jgi:1-deoxy-D-xylulose-5-phosphate reductoisomerase
LGLKDSKQVVDSMTQMHIGFELIQAKWLFDLKAEQLEIIDHPQSIIQSVVQFEDAAMKAQMSQSSMRASIQYAMTYPHRIKSESSGFNFLEHPEWTFELPNPDIFSGIDLCYDVIDNGGTSACVLNASNEIAVAAFLNSQISFTEINQLNKQVLKTTEAKNNPSYDDYLSTHHKSRQTALKLLS